MPTRETNVLAHLLVSRFEVHGWRVEEEGLALAVVQEAEADVCVQGRRVLYHQRLHVLREPTLLIPAGTACLV